MMEWEPRGAACMRGTLRTGVTYDAELRWLDKQYVLSTGHATREEAKGIADAKVAELVKAIKAAVAPLVKDLKHAKP